MGKNMEFRTLGRSDIRVSVMALGSMTWGEQNSEADAHAQLDLACDQGVNFIDTAELYSVPRSAETYGATERFIGTWLARRGGRDQVVLASKVVGPMGEADWIRGGNNTFGRAHLTQALEDSLKRCQTDYFDLYQLHWPERDVQKFGRGGTAFNRQIDRNFTPFEEVLDTLQDFVRQGKVRALGLSNETAWGTMRYLAAHEAKPDQRPRMASIQNAYSLLNRTFEGDLAEVALYEDCGLLAYSTLANGLLTGKYQGGAMPAGSRFTVWQNPRYLKAPYMQPALDAYLALATEHGLDPTLMALAFVNARPFVTANIVGATSIQQLAHNLRAADLTLTAEVLEGIDAIHRHYTNPCP